MDGRKVFFCDDVQGYFQRYYRQRVYLWNGLTGIAYVMTSTCRYVPPTCQWLTSRASRTSSHWKLNVGCILTSGVDKFTLIPVTNSVYRIRG